MKRINLDQMKNMSIDNLIELYRDGYRLEEHTPITPLSDVNISNFPNILSNIHTLQGPLLDPVINFGKVTVSIGYDAIATSIILNTNEGSKLPDPSSGAFNMVWWNSTDYPDPSDDPNKEIVRCTAKTTDTLTVTRAQEGTTATTKNTVGKTYKMILSVTAKMITDISSAITARVVKSGDTMTGTLNLPSNGLIVGTNQLIVSGGNVGIGTASPAQKLDVAGAIKITSNSSNFAETGAQIDYYAGSGRFVSYVPTGSSLEFYTNPNGGVSTLTMLINPAGNVGIGTTSPTATLQIASEGIFEGNVAGLTGLVIQKQGTNDRTTVGITSKGTGQYADLALFHGSDYTTNFEQYRLGYDGSGNYFYLATSKGGTGTLRPLVLDATGVGSNLFKQLYLATSGNVGIGTTVPSDKLDVNGGVILANNNYLQWRASDGNVKNIMILDNNNLFNIITSGSANNGQIIFGTGNGLEKARIDTIGNVGIGTASPQSKLVIVGPSSNTGIELSNEVGGRGVIDCYDRVGAAYKTLQINNDLYVTNNCSALSFTDRTPFYDGDAVTELKAVKGIDGKIDHRTLPLIAQKMNGIEPGRDLGAMISILTKAVQQLTDRIEKLENSNIL